jgi:membrane fusion protein (multidrug efflux system)
LTVTGGFGGVQAAILRLERRLPRAVMLATLAISLGTACKRAEPPAPPTPEVLVTEVVQKDVPIYTEWVGTTVGFVNAQVMPL